MKWKTDYENLYKSDASLFDNDFYKQILQLLNNAENRMNDPLYTPNYELNKNITADEVNYVIDKLKNNKSPGIDKIPNEVLKTYAVKNCLLKFYQYYFDTGIFPSCWNQAIIKPIPKSKSKDPRVPLNYRGINLLSNIYKAYGSIINKRLSTYLESNSLLEDVQNGFRKDRNCLDHIYVLYSIIRNRKNNSLDTFVSYIDFFKCFDIIDRNMLFFKLTEYGIDGKMYGTLKSMYTNTSSCVNINNKMTDWFTTENGCRQGDVNSPTAFSLLINDLLKELNSSGIGVKITSELLVSVLAFADDIVLLAENPEDLQKLIRIVYKWSSKWRFIINPEKSQIVHYRNAPKARTSYDFKLHENGPNLQIVDSYKYLGVYLDEFLTFSHTTEVLATAGGRALGSMINKFRSLADMGHSTYSKLYESLVAPVTDYGSAIWGYKGYKDLDKVQNRAARFFTGVHKFAPIAGYVGDMGWVSNRGRWKLNMLRMWNRLTTLDNSRLTKKIFNWDLTEHDNNNKSNFCAQTKQVLCELGLRDFYHDLRQVDMKFAGEKIAEKEKTDWAENLKGYSKLDLLSEIKLEFGTEKYLQLDLGRYDKCLLSQFRYGILPLEIETGRYKNLTREQRLCTLCNDGSVEDQIHFVFKCSVYNNIRSEFIETCKDRLTGWTILTDVGKITSLFKEQPRLFGKYVKKIFLQRKGLLYK